MTDLAGFPGAELQFDRDGHVVGSSDDVFRVIREQTPTDVLVLNHGWNNDRSEAMKLYQGLTKSLREVLAASGGTDLGKRRFAVVVVLWPSKRFTDTATAPGLIAGFEQPANAGRAVGEQIQELRDVLPSQQAQQALDAAEALIPRLEHDAGARAAFAEHVRALLVPEAFDPEDGSTDLFSLSGEELMERLSVPVTVAPPEGTTEPAMLGVDVETLFGGFWAAAQHLLNYTTYYVMKQRASVVGERGLAPVLTAVKQHSPAVRVHVVGHSFGSRLAAAASKVVPADTVTTLTLLQAAFSHHGFAENWRPGEHGHFRPVINEKKVTGPILVTHSRNDRAVGISYAIASRISGDAASLVGDANDVYGGMGRNGAQRTPEAVPATLLPVGGDYQWRGRCPHNLGADAVIKDHADVEGPEVAYAVLSAMKGT